jgi:hypothetical protein
MRLFLPYTTLIAYLLLLSSCGGNEPKQQEQALEKKTTASFDRTDHTRVAIEFLNGKTVWVPNDYERLTLDEYTARVAQLTQGTVFAQGSVRSLELIGKAGAQVAIFVEKENVQNGFWVHEMPVPYMELSKQAATQYMGMLERELPKRAVAEGYEYEKVETKYLKTKYSRIIKMKYKYNYEDSEIYQTQYLLDANQQNIGVVVKNDAEVDFQDIVARIKL